MYQDPPLEWFPSFQLIFPKGEAKKLLCFLFVMGLIVLTLVSLGFNAYLYLSFSSELREKKFFDANRNEIDLLMLRDGTTFEGVIADESNGDLVIKFATGTAIFKKTELRKITRNAYTPQAKEEKPGQEALT